MYHWKMRVNTRAMSPITLGGSTSQVGLRSYQVKRPALAYFVPCRPPLLVFLVFFFLVSLWCVVMLGSFLENFSVFGVIFGQGDLNCPTRGHGNKILFMLCLSLFAISCSSASNFLFPSHHIFHILHFFCFFSFFCFPG